MKIPIIFSTVTGNSFKLADKIKEGVENKCGPYNIRYITEEVIEMFETFVLVYWCNHGTADQDTIDLINKMKNKNILILGTFGLSTDTESAKKVLNRVNELVSLNNNLLGNFLCQGSIDLNRTFRKVKNIDPSKPTLSLERFEKQMNSIGHPNESELNDALNFVRAKLNKSLSVKQ